MSLDPGCLSVAAALAAGERADAAHLAACVACAERARLTTILRTVPPPAPVVRFSAPDTRALGRAVSARRARAAGLAAALAAGFVAALLSVPTRSEPGVRFAALADPASPPAHPPLLDVVDEAARALDPAPAPGDDLLALLDPPDEPSSHQPDPTLDALLGDGDL